MVRPEDSGNNPTRQIDIGEDSGQDNQPRLQFFGPANQKAGVILNREAIDGCPETPGCAQAPSEVEIGSEFRFLEPALGAAELGWLGTYRVVKLLGKGGMGLVFLAEDPRLQRQVALKIMRPELAEIPIARQRFLREARAMALIKSDHVVTVYEVGQHNDLPYLATELLLGEGLDGWLEHNQNPHLSEILNFGVQIARGLEAAHKSGMIHRDIKPANIWIEPAGRIKLLDFGLVRTLEETSCLTDAGTVLGTPAYMAPEQADGRPIDERCDLFSLGCVLYEMASGCRPFNGSCPVIILKATALDEPAALEEFNTQLPPGFSDLVMRLLAKDPDNRPASAAEVIEELETIIAGTAPAKPLKRPSTHQRIVSTHRRTVQRRRIVLVIGLASLVMLAFLLAPVAFSLLHPSGSKSASIIPPASTVQGVTNEEILLGMSGPFSGPALELGRDMEVGIRTYFQHINDQGGIAGRKLKLVALDDGYKPDRALANMKVLNEQHKVFAVIGNVGTPTAEKAMPYALANKMIFFGAFTGAPMLRKDPPDRYVFNYRASYAEETSAMVRYLIEIKSMRPQQIAVFAQQDGYGDAGFHGVVKSLRGHGVKTEAILRVGHVRNSVDVTEAVQEILRHKEIRAVIMVSTYRPASQFIRQLKDAKADLVFANVSFVGADALAEELLQINPEYAEGVIVTQVVPPPSSQSSVVINYRQLLQRYYSNEKVTFGSLEGFIGAAVFCEGLRKVGSNLTTETLVDGLETIQNFDLGLGTSLYYRPSEHQASHKVWGTVLDRSGNYQTLELE